MAEKRIYDIPIYDELASAPANPPAGFQKIYPKSGNWYTLNSAGVETQIDLANPGGADTQVQFNDSGTLTGDVAFVWENTNKKLGIGGGSVPTHDIEINYDSTLATLIDLPTLLAANSEATQGDGSSTFNRAALIVKANEGGGNEIYGTIFATSETAGAFGESVVIGTPTNTPILFTEDALGAASIYMNVSSVGVAIGQGSTLPESDALLELDAPNKALLITRVSDPSSDITTPVNGMIVYDNTDDEIQAYIGGSWLNIGGTIGGSLSANEIAFGSATDTITSSSDLTWNNTTKVLVTSGTDNTLTFDGNDDNSLTLDNARAGQTTVRGLSVNMTGSGNTNNKGLRLLVDQTATTNVGIEVSASNATTNRAIDVLNGNIIVRGSGKMVVGDTTIEADAILELESTDKALLITRVSDPSSDISSPVNGMITYDSTDNQLQAYINGSWTALGTGVGTPAGSDTEIQYNDAGSFGASPFFVWDDSNNRLGIGVSSPLANIHVQKASTASEVYSVLLENIAVAQTTAVGLGVSVPNNNTTSTGVLVDVAGSNTTAIGLDVNVENSTDNYAILARTGLSGFGLDLDTPSSRVQIRGEGTTDSTSALLVEDSSMNPLLFVRDDGPIGVSTASPSDDASLDLAATDKALLLNRVADPSGDISTPVNGMIVYDSTDDELQAYINGSWIDIGSTISGLTQNLLTKSNVAGDNIEDSEFFDDGTNKAIGEGYLLSDRNEQLVVSFGNNSTDGDAQESKMLAKGSTADNTQTEIFLDGSSERIGIASDAVAGFTIYVIAVQESGVAGTPGDTWYHKFEGTIKNIGGTTSLIGSVTETTIAEDSGTSSYSTTIDADDSNDTLRIQVTGETNKNIKWTAKVVLDENRY